MAALVGFRGQISHDRSYDASGTITTGGTAQLILPEARTRSSLILINISSVNMFFEIGGARATASLTNGTVTSCAITNSGFGYSRAPSVVFYGGALGAPGSPNITVTGALNSLPEYTSPSSPAKAHCVMTGSAPNMSVSSIVIDSAGSGYAFPPYVYLANSALDPFGAATPSATNGILLLANGGSYTPNGSVCITDQISVFCATTSSAYCCKFTL